MSNGFPQDLLTSFCFLILIMAAIDLTRIPKEPGCYLYKDDKGTIIYVGKAKDLSKRVRSYFSKKHLDKTALLVQNISSVDFIVTSSEAEALLLENTLIKKHQPKYNVDLKNGQRYAYIRITNETFPRLVVARDQREKGKYFGPFVSGQVRDDILQTLIKTFHIRTCKRLPKRACLRYHINLCDAPCVAKISEEEYNLAIEKCVMVLKGKTKELVKHLIAEMNIASKQMRYEDALLKKRQIDSLQWLDERQSVERNKTYDEDIINYRLIDSRVYLILFNIYKGTLTRKQEFVFDETPDFFEEFLERYYEDHSIPKELIVPVAVSDVVKEHLGIKVVTVPKVGEKKKLLGLVDKNIELSFFADLARLEELKEKLKLPVLPRVIECFDISHLGGTHVVASMVQFRDGKAAKENYRRFKMSNEVNDDFLNMAEVVRRRYKRLLSEKAELPELIVIDGGKGQLAAAFEEMKALGIRIPMIGLAKQFEEIFFPGMSRSLVLGRSNKGLQLLQAIRDEAHRFAITYNRLLRKKSLKE